jgi:membrane fusion protein (multidrug efflux system)
MIVGLEPPEIGDGGSKYGGSAMPVEMTEKERASEGAASRVDAPPTGESISGEHEARQSVRPSPDRRPSRRRRLLIGVLGALIVAAAGVFGVPWMRLMLNTVSTDDAYVNGHVTFVAPRVSGQISRVMVDDNYRVRKGELLAELDKEPYQIAVSQKRAAVDTANADLQAAISTARGIEAQAVSRRWKMQSAVEDLENQVALLHDRVAALNKAKATLALAQADFERATKLLGTPAESRQEYDRYQEGFSTASAQVTQARPSGLACSWFWDCRYVLRPQM